MQYIEVEIRIHLESDAAFADWLSKEATYIGQSHQVDKYFQHPQMPFVVKDINGLIDSDHWLRIRQGKDGCELCYKLWHRDPTTKESLYADEVETLVNNYEALEKLFQMLGYESISVIDKTRDSWRYGDFKIERDEVANLGKFYEIEFCGNVEDPTNAKQHIFDLLSTIGINNWRLIDRGYPWMQWNGIK